MNNTRIYRLSALWMQDHLEVWPSDETQIPEGEFKGKVWVGPLDSDQVAEIESRATSYLGRDGFCRDAWPYCDAAARVINALKKGKGNKEQ
jgi:hypothetical protein